MRCFRNDCAFRCVVNECKYKRVCDKAVCAKIASKHKSARIAFENVYASNDLTVSISAANLMSAKTVFTYVYKECKIEQMQIRSAYKKRVS
jgi:hypothetical protein